MDWSNRNFKIWIIKGTLGIIIFGSGLCLFSEAAFYKATHPPIWKWITFGTTSLIVLMSGLLLMIDSLRFRMNYENEKQNK